MLAVKAAEVTPRVTGLALRTVRNGDAGAATGGGHNA